MTSGRLSPHRPSDWRPIGFGLVAMFWFVCGGLLLSGSQPSMIVGAALLAVGVIWLCIAEEARRKAGRR